MHTWRIAKRARLLPLGDLRRVACKCLHAGVQHPQNVGVRNIGDPLRVANAEDTLYLGLEDQEEGSRLRAALLIRGRVVAKGAVEDLLVSVEARDELRRAQQVGTLMPMGMPDTHNDRVVRRQSEGLALWVRQQAENRL